MTSHNVSHTTLLVICPACLFLCVCLILCLLCLLSDIAKLVECLCVQLVACV